MAEAADIEFMQLALRLARKGRGKTSPNPMVGAVIVRNEKIVGEGYHRAAGKEHAEISALRKAASRARGATLFVSLEPCCHTGRTGPCTDAIVTAGISRVVLAARDPNPLVNGKGIRALKRAGIEVVTGLLRQEALLLNDAYIGYHRNRRPFVTLKLAQSLDGRIATSEGQSKYLSSPASRQYVHRLRAEVDAVIVGAGTAKADNPALTVRHVKGDNPYRIVVTASGRLPSGLSLLKGNRDHKTIIATTEKHAAKAAGQKQGRHLIYWSLKQTRDGLIDLHDLLEKADSFGLRSLLVEGGSRLATSFVRSGLVDKMVIVSVPVILGKGIEAIGDLGVRDLKRAVSVNIVDTTISGPDTIFVGYPGKGV